MRAADMNIAENKSLSDKSPGFLGILLHRGSYHNLLYAFMSFASGVLYFIYLTVGVSLSISLVPLLLGVPLFVAVAAGARGMAAFEANYAGRLLREPIHLPQIESLAGRGWWARLQEVLTDTSTYKSFLFLLLRFPLGLFSLVLATLAAGGILTIGVALAGIVLSQTMQVNLFAGNEQILSMLGMRDGPLEQGLLGIVTGVLLSTISMHMVNLITGIQGRLAMWAASSDRV